MLFGAVKLLLVVLKRLFAALSKRWSVLPPPCP
jgi:hypothetical protein